MSQLNEKQLAQFKGQLDDQQAQIRLTINTIFDASSHISHHLAVKNLARLSTDELIEFTLKVDIPELTKTIDRLKKIDASLMSIELGMYGLCSDCESEIIQTLLERDPTTQRCPDCEAKYQKQRYNNYRL
jgi:DnaK suppressor protein